MDGYLQKSNLSSTKKTDRKQLRSRLVTGYLGAGWYEVDTWLDKDGGLKIELSKHTPRNTESIVLKEGNISESFS